MVEAWRNGATNPTDSPTSFISVHQMLMSVPCCVPGPRAGVWATSIDLGVISALILDTFFHSYSILSISKEYAGSYRFSHFHCFHPVQHSTSRLDHCRHLLPIFPASVSTQQPVILFFKKRLWLWPSAQIPHEILMSVIVGAKLLTVVHKALDDLVP